MLNLPRTAKGYWAAEAEGWSSTGRMPSRRPDERSEPKGRLFVTGASAGSVLLDGAALARTLRERAGEAAAEISRHSAPPSLRVLLVGENPASQAYVASKAKAATEAGIRAETLAAAGRHLTRRPARRSRARRTPTRTSTASSSSCHCLPATIPPASSTRSTRSRTSTGFIRKTSAFSHQGRPRFVPCTPAGVMELLAAYEIPIKGRTAVVLGRSDIVGKPMAALLTARDATVTVCHSKTRDLAAVCREADILVAAIGRPGFVTREFVREGAAVIDVGINRLSSVEGAPEGLARSARIRKALEVKGRILVGDVDFDDVSPVAGWITPVPGGIGPLTVAMLLQNTIKAAGLRINRK